MTNALTPGKRDPEGRRRAILEAAAEIIVTQGSSALTHRAVAKLAGVSLGSTTQYFSSIDELRELALTDLAQEIEHALESVEANITDADSIPETLARDTYEFLLDPRAVRADSALMSNGMVNPDLRPLALLWNDRLIDILSAHIDTERATAIALYLDGALMHAGLHSHPVSETSLRSAIRALIAMH